MKKNKIFFTQSTAFLTGILGISLGIIDKINTSDSLSYFISIFKEPWFLQGMLVNASFTICSIPLSYNFLQKLFKNRKRNRIKEARNELELYCLQKLITKEELNKGDFDTQLFIISNKYRIKIKDVFVNEEEFRKNLALSIININLIDEHSKENIIYKIKHNNLFKLWDTEKNNITFFQEHDANSYEDEYDDIYNDFDDDNINYSDKENKKILKYTCIISIVIFLSLLIFTSIIHILFNVWGIDSIILFNTIIMMIFTFPMIINGVENFENFDARSKLNFYFLSIILLLILINFFCIISIIK
jgi:hypothetical protein